MTTRSHAQSDLLQTVKAYPLGILVNAAFLTVVLLYLRVFAPNPAPYLLTNAFKDVFLVYASILLFSLVFFRAGLLVFWVASTAIALYFLALFAYAIRYDAAVEAYQYFAVWQTHFREAADYLRYDLIGGLTWSQGFLAFLALLPILYATVSIFRALSTPPRPTRRTRIILASVLICAMIPCLLTRGQGSYLSMILVTKRAHDQAVAKLTASIDAFKNDASKVDVPPKAETDETLVVLVGESLSPRHMALYGYPRPTTPRLSARNDLIVFDDVLSTYTHTEQALFHILSSAKLRAASPYETTSFLTVYEDSVPVLAELNAAGFDTDWISNQYQYGVRDTMTSAQSALAKHRVFLNKGGVVTYRVPYDEAMLPSLDAALSRESPGGKAIFLHMMGSHMPYQERFPKDRAVFKGPPSPQYFGRLSLKHPERVNDYDNSVRETDAFVDAVIERLRKRAGVSSLVFFSDHGEDVFHALGHNGGKTFAMFQTPVVVWVSDGFIARYPDKVAALKVNRTKKISNEDLYTLILDLAGIASKNLDPTRSLARDAFVEKPRLGNVESRGVIDLDRDYPNPTLDARRALSRLPAALRAKLVCGRVTTIGALYDADFAGFGALQVDAFWQTDRLVVGRGPSTAVGLTVDDWLRSPYARGKRVTLTLHRLADTQVTCPGFFEPV